MSGKIASTLVITANELRIVKMTENNTCKGVNNINSGTKTF